MPFMPWVCNAFACKKTTALKPSRDYPLTPRHARKAYSPSKVPNFPQQKFPLGQSQTLGNQGLRQACAGDRLRGLCSANNFIWL
jgi:hypothetical protein